MSGFLVNPGGTVQTGDIDDGAVTTAKIGDDAVTLAKMAGGTDGNLITFDANGDPSYVATGTAGQVLTSGGAGVAPTMQDISGGKILQVVQDEITAAVTITGVTTFTDITGLAVTITPSSSSNTILIAGVLRIGYQGGTGPSVRLIRDSTVIHLGDASGSEQRGLWSSSQLTSVVAEGEITSIPIYFVDSPATTSAVTYKFQLRNDNSGHTSYVNRTYATANATQRARVASNLVASEISA